MKRFRKWMTLVVALGLLLAGTLPATGAPGKGKPIEVERWDDTFVEDPDPFLQAVCGVEVRSVFRDKGSFVLFSDFSAKVHFNFEVKVIDPDTGKTLATERDAANIFISPVAEIVDEEAGTLTLMFEDTFIGLPFKIMAPGHGVVIRDAGKVTFKATVVIDLETGEEIDFQFEESAKGPHPSLALDDEGFTELLGTLCAILGGELSEFEPGDPVPGTEVDVIDFAFEPQALLVDVGNTVTWTWQGEAPHSVTGEDFDSGVQADGTFEHTFNQAGEFFYFCVIHPFMEGVIVVEEP